MKRLFLMVILVSIVLVNFGCRRPYDVPEYKEIQNNETGFVIPLEGETSDQAQFNSADYLKSRQIAEKRIRIPHRWNQTGRIVLGVFGKRKGEYLPTVKLLKVNRTPVTREWTPSEKTGTSRKDEGIWVESKDSVGFSTGFSCTAHVEEDDAALFLYKYPAGSLADVMDTQIRARIQTMAAETCAEYDMDALRAEKPALIAKIRGDVEPFFKKNGITVTTIGMFGGFTYENPAVQTAIDDVFRSQQLEDVAEAKRKAALKDKETILITAEAEAAAINKLAEAEANKIEKVNTAAEKAQKNPLFYQLRLLDTENKRIDKWDGSYPNWYMGGDMKGTNPNILLGVDAGGQK